MSERKKRLLFFRLVIMKIHFEREATEQRVIRFLIQLSISRIDGNPIKNYCIITPKYVVAFEIKIFSINCNDNNSVI